MSKKLLAFNISLLMILNAMLPGTIAFSEMSEEPSDALDTLIAEVETSKDQLVLEEETTLEEELVLEEEALIEEPKALEQDQVLQEDESIEVDKSKDLLPKKEEVMEIKRNILYEKLMATKSNKDVDAIMEKTGDEELESLSEEEMIEIKNHINAFEVEKVVMEIKIVYPTVNFDNVAPLKEAVTGGNN